MMTLHSSQPQVTPGGVSGCPLSPTLSHSSPSPLVLPGTRPPRYRGSGSGRRCRGLAGRGAALGGVGLSPQGSWCCVTTEAPGSRRAAQERERRAALGSASAQPWCPWGSVVPQFPHLPRALCSDRGCLRASRWLWGPGPLCWGVGGLGGRMVLVMSPAPHTSGPCTQVSSPGSSCRTKPLSHTPIWCCLPSANLGDTGGTSDLPSQHPGPQG